MVEMIDYMTELEQYLHPGDEALKETNSAEYSVFVNYMQDRGLFGLPLGIIDNDHHVFYPAKDLAELKEKHPEDICKNYTAEQTSNVYQSDNLFNKMCLPGKLIRFTGQQATTVVSAYRRQLTKTPHVLMCDAEFAFNYLWHVRKPKFIITTKEPCYHEKLAGAITEIMEAHERGLDYSIVIN